MSVRLPTKSLSVRIPLWSIKKPIACNFNITKFHGGCFPNSPNFQFWEFPKNLFVVKNIFSVPSVEFLSLTTTIWLSLSQYPFYIWDKGFMNGPSEICGRQLLKNFKWYGLLSSTNFTWSILCFIYWSIVTCPNLKAQYYNRWEQLQSIVYCLGQSGCRFIFVSAIPWKVKVEIYQI